MSDVSGMASPRPSTRSGGKLNGFGGDAAAGKLCAATPMSMARASVADVLEPDVARARGLLHPAPNFAIVDVMFTPIALTPAERRSTLVRRAWMPSERRVVAHGLAGRALT